MAKTISREEFRRAVGVCRRIQRQVHHGIASKDIEEVIDQIIGIWATGLESYLFDRIPPRADPEEPKA